MLFSFFLFLFFWLRFCTNFSFVFNLSRSFNFISKHHIFVIIRTALIFPFNLRFRLIIIIIWFFLPMFFLLEFNTFIFKKSKNVLVDWLHWFASEKVLIIIKNFIYFIRYIIILFIHFNILFKLIILIRYFIPFFLVVSSRFFILILLVVIIFAIILTSTFVLFSSSGRIVPVIIMMLLVLFRRIRARSIFTWRMFPSFIFIFVRLPLNVSIVSIGHQTILVYLNFKFVFKFR